MKVRLTEKKLVEMIEKIVNEDMPVMSRREVMIDVLSDRIYNKLSDIPDTYDIETAYEVLDRAKQRLRVSEN